MAFAIGDRMDAKSPIRFPKDVAPGECLEISIAMIAPSTPGNYTGNWGLQFSDNPETRFGFGETNVGSLDAKITVMDLSKLPLPLLM